MMQRKNRPITIKIDTGDNTITLPALLFALAQNAQNTPFSGRITLSVGRRGLSVYTPQNKGKST